MAWLLTTPLSNGDLDTAPTTHIDIDDFRCRKRNQILFGTLDYGRYENNAWVSCLTPRNAETTFEIRGQDFVDLVTTHTANQGELTWEAVKRGLWPALLAQGIVPPGTIV